MAGSQVVAGLILGSVLLAGCTSASSGVTSSAHSSVLASDLAGTAESHPGAAPGSTTRSATRSTVSSSVSSAATSTVIRTKPGATITVGPPKATVEPAAVSGECPYLNADAVSTITGQHHGPTQLIAVSPHPTCVFYRSDGGLIGSIRVIQAANPQAAAAAVNQHVPVAGSQPATQPPGWVGGSMTTPGQMTQDSTAKSVYAVAKGNIAVVVEENESPSIKARVLAICAIYGLGLAPGQASDYCSAA